MGRARSGRRAQGSEAALPMIDAVPIGQAAYAERDWRTAYEQLSAAEAERHQDLERLAAAAYLTGHDSEAAAALVRAHRTALRDGDRRAAARAAFWLGLHLLLRGQSIHGGGWLARAERLLGDLGDDCVERGYLLIPAGLAAI